MNQQDEAFEKWFGAREHNYGRRLAAEAWREGWRARGEHYGIGKPEALPMTRERILAMEPEELRERVALDVMGWQLIYARHSTFWATSDRQWAYSFSEWTPEVNWGSFGIVVEAMEKMGWCLDTSSYTKYSAYRWLRARIRAMNSLKGESRFDRATICRAALCAVHGV